MSYRFVNVYYSGKIAKVPYLTLGIESSCDETAAALIEDAKKCLSSVVASQVDIHKEYGGVVPEIASRKHVELILPVIDKAIKDAGVGPRDIDGIAVTSGPGLIGSLMVGLSTAKALSYGLGVPLIGVNHLEAHLSAVHLEHEITFPYVGLVVSGGHTSLYLVRGYTEFELLGKTRDDAAGEAFDKGAKLLGLNYPGGVEIDRLAKQGSRDSIRFPRPFKSSSTPDFSFSGLKTSLLYYLKREPKPDHKRMMDICASYQEAIVETLVDKTLTAAKENDVNTVVIAGGVACNTRLRESASDRMREKGVSVLIPSPEYCTDNAAMIGSLGAFRLMNGESSELDLNTFSTARAKYIRERGTVQGSRLSPAQSS